MSISYAAIPRAKETREAVSRQVAERLHGVMEAIVLGMVCLSPWAFGATNAVFELLLYVGLAVLLVLWGFRMVLGGVLTWKKCPVTLGLAALFLVGAVQLIPLPRPVLALLAPATARNYAELLPSQPEIVAGDKQSDRDAGVTLSLYPYRTRKDMTRLLAVLLLFVVVRNNLASRESLRRLSVAAVANGCLLAVAGLWQHFAMPSIDGQDHFLYGIYQVSSAAFGPFAYRNHFAFYVNLCLCLGLGLLCSLLPCSPRPRAWGRGVGGEKLHPLLPLMLLSLIVLFAGLIGSQSRAGLLSFLAAAGLWIGWMVLRARRVPSAAVVLPAIVLGGAFCLWLCFGLEGTRYESLVNGQAMEDHRAYGWSQTLPLAWDSPLCGSGYGTYATVQQARRMIQSSDDNLMMYWPHAHNEYLEVLVEAGLVSLLLALFTIGAALRLGLRAVAPHRSNATRNLGMGALLAFGAVLIHSFFDYGLHVPAVVVLLTVVCAQLCALGDAPAAARGEGKYMFRLGGAAPVLGAFAVASLGSLLCGEGWKTFAAQRLVFAAFGASERGQPPSADRVAYLEAAARLLPDSADLQMHLADAHRDAVEEGLGREHALAAVRHALRARDLCPLLPVPHVRLAANVALLTRSDGRDVYLERAKRLLPYDGEFWYLCGVEEFGERQRERAAASWRRALELLDGHLAEVVETASRAGDQGAFLMEALPDRPEQLIAAARQLYPLREDRTLRRPLMERALRLLEAQASGRAENLHLRAVAYVSLDRPAEACDAYEAALGREPGHENWRFEFAELLYERGELEKARRELERVLAKRADDGPARELLDRVVRAIVKKGL